jgi:hypothetical protein
LLAEIVVVDVKVAGCIPPRTFNLPAEVVLTFF